MIINYIKEKILGYSLPQEFACLALEEIRDPLRVAVTIKGADTFLDVSSTHLFLGYKPLVIGIPIQEISGYHLFSNADEICLSFFESEFRPNTTWKGFVSYDGSLARIILKKKEILKCGDHAMHLFEGVYAKHEFINSFNQFINKQKEKRRLDRKVNINLSENLADQVQTAYSVPRAISIVTLFENQKMNMFPTDLHGQVNDGFYVGSLRHGGKANDQVERAKIIALSRIDFSWCKQAYALGKNHMQDLKDFSSFLVSNKRSRSYNIPLPESVAAYYELERVDSVDIGIHRIHKYKILYREKLNDSKTLGHIHRFYAQWRLNNGKSTKFYWR